MLVSAIMPTRGRPELAQQALDCFLAQTYQNKEIVIVDDTDDPSFNQGYVNTYLAYGYQVHYYQLNTRLTVGAKRNLACSRANGESKDVLIHWDSDDWSAPERMEDQVTRLIDSNVGLTGYNRMRFYDVISQEWWRFNGDKHQALGTSMCYTREFWREHPFPDLNEGEDSHVVNRAGRVVNVDAGDMMWARSHSGNTSKEGHEKKKGAYWTKL